MTNPPFLTCPAAPVETAADEVADESAPWVLVTVLVSVRTPVAVVTATSVDLTTVSVDLTADSVPDAEAETEVEVESVLTSLVGKMVEPPAMITAGELVGVVGDEAALQAAFLCQLKDLEARCACWTYRW